jgi:HAE1 family hydrophobic/amphiphilic exporter-1
MALTLSVGFVVDDAIVMLGNIVRHMEAGEAPLARRSKGRGESASSSRRLSCGSVHSHAVRGRILGRLLHEFAVTIMAGAGVGFVSLTLTPMLQPVR